MELTWYLCDESRQEVMELPASAKIDLELGGGYGDCQLTIDKGIVKSRYWIYCPDTEYIACLEDLSVDTSKSTEMWIGNSVRKFLEKAIIKPPAGQDYKVVSGEVNAILSDIINPLFSSVFKVTEESSTMSVRNFSFPRYCTVYDGIVKLVQSVGGRIDIRAVSTDSGFDIVISAVKAQNVTHEFGIEFSEDAAETIEIDMFRRGINHLVCLGGGELKDRTVVDLYLQPDGSVGIKQYYKGFDERTETYDYSGVESVEDLMLGGEQRMKEVASYTNFTLTPNENEELNIGDFITARSYYYGIAETVEVVKKLVKIENGFTNVEYETERKGYV